jgi:endonuclease/exonuclease/phosphatase family metal-dependent hydrolase
MSFNTQHCQNYLEQKIDFQTMADAILSCGADIVGLNEMRDKGEDPEYDRQTAILSELTGMEHFYFAKAIDVRGKNPYGNAILSKLPIVSAETIPVPDPEPRSEAGRHYETRCLLKAKLENGFTVLVIHFGLNPDEQENAAATVLQHLEDKKCILMGDFNVLPENPVLNGIRARMKDAADLFPQPLMSFPSDAPDRKIDYIFVSPDIEVITANIPAIVASDHRPHTAEIKI